MTFYYNEIDPYAAAWLRNLIAAGHIAPGDVDERSIVDVQHDDIRSYEQCHFFAGIGGWSCALRLAGWSDDRPVWTGSCPCQPFSVAGAQRGSADERHLWPAFFRLIRECRPSIVFGEQVAGSSGLAWIDHVLADLENAGYAAAAAIVPACAVGAPHRRERLWWMADIDEAGRGIERQHRIREDGHAHSGDDADRRRADGDFLGDTERNGHKGREIVCACSTQWSDAAWIKCTDGKQRPSQSGIFPLVDGVFRDLVRGRDSGVPIDANSSPEARSMRLIGYGNAIVPQVAAEVIAAYMECRP